MCAAGWMRPELVINEKHARQAHVYLAGCIVVRMRMEPGGACRLIDFEYRTPGTARFDGLMRAAIDFARNRKSVPMDCRIAIKGVKNRDRDLVASQRPDHGAENGTRISISYGGFPFDEFMAADGSFQGHRFALACRVDQLRDRQGSAKVQRGCARAGGRNPWSRQCCRGARRKLTSGQHRLALGTNGSRTIRRQAWRFSGPATRQ